MLKGRESQYSVDSMTNVPRKNSPTDINRVIRLINNRAITIASKTVTTVKSEVAGYRNVPDEEIFNQCIENVSLAVSSLRSGEIPDPGEMMMASIALLRAQQGVPVEDVLHAYRLSLGEIKKCFIAVSKGVLPPELIVEGICALWASTDAVATELGRLHQKQRFLAANRDEQMWSHLFAGLLAGRLTPDELEKTTAHYDLNPERMYIPILLRGATEGQQKDFKRKIDNQHQGLKQQPIYSIIDGDLVCLVKNVPDSTTDFDDICVGVGAITELETIPREWRNANHALTTAMIFGLTGFHTIDSLGLRCLVVSEVRVGLTLVERYCQPLIDRGEFGTQILDSVWYWLRSERNIKSSADGMFVHPNTLRYRLRKFEEIIDTDFDNLTSLVEIWWALERWRITRNQGSIDMETNLPS